MAPFVPRRFGNYLLTGLIGRGGMAEVFRAQLNGAAGFERQVVVKRILQPYNSNPSFVQMFINEAKIAASLTHPNIVQVYELGEVDGEYFMAMEYVRGKDLLRVLRAVTREVPRKPMQPEAAAYIAREICRGLSHAHEHTDQAGAPQPIVHRDVSPQNIMVTYDGQVKLVDFGIAKARHIARQETSIGVVKGKCAYMSPEQVVGQPPGPESDVFATGVVLYEMLVCKRLFKGPTDFETMKNVKSMPITPPRQLYPEIPEALEQVTLHALARERADRFARATQMARELDEYLLGARFSVESMAEFIGSLFPPNQRDEAAEDPTPPPMLPEDSASESSKIITYYSSSHRSITAPTGRARPVGARDSKRAREETSPGTPSALAVKVGRRTSPPMVAMSLGAALVIGVGGAWMMATRARGPITRSLENTAVQAAPPIAPAEPTPTATALPPPAGAPTPVSDPPASAPEPPPGAPVAPEPSPAQAHPGPTGPTRHPPGHASTSHAARPPVATPGKPHKLKIPSFDEIDQPDPKDDSAKE